jgi:hypothetical protein
MQAGEVEAVAVNGVLATISSGTVDHVTIAVITIVTTALYDGTLTFKKRQNRANRPNNTQNLTATACAYEKQSDKSVASAAIVPGAGVTQMYAVDISGCDLLPEITGRTAGSISMYWDVVWG